MMIGIEERLRHSAFIQPNSTIDVYPGDVLEVLDAAIAERDALRAALVSLVDGKSEFDIVYDTGMDAAEALKIMDLAYNRKR